MPHPQKDTKIMDINILEIPGNVIRTAQGLVWSASINSRAISSVQYRLQEQHLTLQFTDGKVHTYWGVPLSVYVDFMLSSSKGRYFNAYIRNNYA